MGFWWFWTILGFLAGQELRVEFCLCLFVALWWGKSRFGWGFCEGLVEVGLCFKLRS